MSEKLALSRTKVYDADGRLVRATGPSTLAYFGAAGPGHADAMPALEVSTHEVELRPGPDGLVEVAVPISSPPGAGHCVAVDRVRLAFDGEARGPCGEVAVEAAVRGGQLVCTARLSGFAAGGPAVRARLTVVFLPPG